MSNPVRFGILSTAWITNLAIPSLQRSALTYVAAVASRSKQRAANQAARFGIKRAYASYDELLSADDVDAVYIAVPNSLHAEWTKAALAAGKHVLCEKPLAPTAAEAEELFGLARERGLLLMEGFMYRHHPQTILTQDLVSGGAIGEVRAIQCSFHVQAAAPETNIRYDPTLAGGALYDVGSYCVSFANLIVGEQPRAVYGVARQARTGVDENFYGLLEYPGGAVAEFDCGMDSVINTGVRVVGTEARITVDNPWLPDIRAPIWFGSMPPTRVVVSRGTDGVHHPCEGEDPYQLQFENFAAAVTGQEQPRVTGAETVRNLQTIERLYTAASGSLDRGDRSSPKEDEQ